MRTTVIPAFLVALGGLGGCAVFDSLAPDQEARQLAWTGPGAGPCLWGGVTPQADAHCSRVRLGVAGELAAVNTQVRAALGNDHNCLDHVESLKRQLAGRPDLRAESIYSCPLAARARGECHVSLLVTTRHGDRYVLDNGAVVAGTVGSDGVAAFADYRAAVRDEYWIGLPPTAEDFASLR